MYDQIYFDRRVEFHPSIHSELYLVRQFWSEKLISLRTQCLLRHQRFIEVRWLPLMSLVKLCTRRV